MAQSDIYQLLEHDHREVQGFFRQLEGGDVGAAETTFARLTEELLRHMAAEEETFYVALEAKPRTAGLIAAGEREHDEARSLVAGVRDAPGSAAWRQQVARLEQAVEHHIQEEEGGVFAAARQELNKRQSEVLAAAFQDRKRAIG